ncbi:hypothetical protein [Chryseobacterium sp. Leaf394]|uniref:hypothetical protein n=1 Tax=Chryseobacterium sp. Leaf394 TaxID=1736361 RepID=UPI0007000EFA|nr:hypothetical protein [Chryseobacterium sp. Leaf394]KQS93087.1 hypothetical protein ASG21_11865 [Chryseobacterium sp. Leaf394]
MAMADFKKYITIKITVIFILMSCEKNTINGQTNTISLEKKEQMKKRDNYSDKKFDIKKYEKQISENPTYQSFIRASDETEVEQYYILKEEYDFKAYEQKYVDSYIEKETDKNGFITFYSFYQDGKIKETEFHFSEIEYGVWKKYDTDGFIISEINKDENYPFSLLKVIEFANKKGRDSIKGGGTFSRNFSQTHKKYVYNVELYLRNNKDPHTQIYTLDAADGKILEQERKGIPRIVL